jgi:hypothetical protein
MRGIGPWLGAAVAAATLSVPGAPVAFAPAVSYPVDAPFGQAEVQVLDNATAGG